MCWPFRRKRAYYQDEDASGIIPLYNTNYEEAITSLLERAESLAADREPGEVFEVELEERWQIGTNPIEIIGPVMIRAKEYGLEVQYSMNWSFFFRKA